MLILLKPRPLAVLAGVCVFCALAVYSAPLSSSSADSDADSLLLAIQAVNRARRESTKAKGTQPARSLVRYRYPIHIKRSGLDADVQGPMGDDIDEEDVDLSQLARVIALDLLMEAEDQNEGFSHSHPAVAEVDKRKKKSDNSRLVDDDIDKKKKRMKNLLDQVLEEEEESDEGQGVQENSDILEQLFRSAQDESADDELTDDDEQAIYESIIQALTDEGVADAQIQALLPKLQSGDFKSRDRKRSSEWKKLPRASARWRSRFENDVIAGRQKADPEEMEPWKSLGGKVKYTWDGKVYGKGFHRGLRGMRDESRAGSKRDQSPWQKNPSEIHKRSVSSASHQDDKHSSSNEKQSQDPVVLSRKRRSVSQVEAISSDKTLSDEMKAPSVDIKITNHTKDQAVPANFDTAEKVKELKETTALSAGVAGVNHPVNIRKKSVNWDDYFGYDKRSDNSNQDLKDLLESEYYKMVAASLSSRRKRMPHGEHEGMHKKRSNVTFWNKRQDDSTAEDDQDDDNLSDVDQFKAFLISNLMDELGEEGLEEISSNLRQKLAEALEEEEGSFLQGIEELSLLDDDDNDDDRDTRKRSPYLPPLVRVASAKGQVKERRKRYPLNTFSRSQARRLLPLSIEPSPKEVGECPVFGRIVSTCNVVSHLMGGYRQLLTDACHQYEACSICSDDNHICEGEYYRRVSSLCGSDLLCRSQSRRLLSGLGDFHEMEEDLSKGTQEQMGSLCSHDHCLARFWKRR